MILLVVKIKDGDRCVDSSEFISEYFKLGDQERKKHMLAHREKTMKNMLAKKKLKEERDKKMLDLLKPVISYDYSEADETSAIRKVARVAYTYDREKDSCIQVILIISFIKYINFYL